MSTFHSPRLRGSIVLLLAALLTGCAVYPQHPTGQSEPSAQAACTDASVVSASTPAPVDDTGYALHFVEFDDQGWLFPDKADPAHPDGTPNEQINGAMADIVNKLKNPDDKVLTFVYVHGWKHSAAESDCDVQRFRALLRSRAELFKTERRVVGIYVGWQGNSLDAPLLRELTFWGRKNAASHVADGRVRELFSRIRGLRDYYNGPLAARPTGNTLANSESCDWTPSVRDGCKLRTIMIGHSFGGLILYSSAAPYLMEMLSVSRDQPKNSLTELDRKRKSARARSLADLIVLLNPAFEGTRYEPLHQVSRYYTPLRYEPPILVMLTSTADWATKNAFPVARTINSVFQYPASSDEQSVAMRRTPGHTDRHLSHELCLEGAGCEAAPPEGQDAPAWADSRRFCGGMVLGRYKHDPEEIGPRPLVWNVRTHGTIIADHNDIAGPYVYRFIEQIYGEVNGTNNSGCEDGYQPPVRPPAAD